jgi:U1 small nuclear ribonucleoprotein C
MPKYFCEYCGIYLTHSSPGGRKQHSHGRKHINNKIEYYSQFLYEFQQNTYSNLLNMASKMSSFNPMQNLPQQTVQGGSQLQNFQRFILPTSNIRPNFQQMSNINQQM